MLLILTLVVMSLFKAFELVPFYIPPQILYYSLLAGSIVGLLITVQNFIRKRYLLNFMKISIYFILILPFFIMPKNTLNYSQILVQWGLLLAITTMVLAFTKKLHHTVFPEMCFLTQAARSEINSMIIDPLDKSIANESNHSSYLLHLTNQLRTPLTSIISTSNIINSATAKSKAAKQWVPTIGLNAKNLLNMIDDILDLTRIEDGLMTIKKTQCDIKHLMLPIIEKFQEKAKLKNLKLEITTITSIPQFIYTDASHLTQIIDNLLDNAIKFTDSGNVYLTTELVLNSKTENETLVFRIKDQGEGIPDVVRNMLFEPFSGNEIDASHSVGLGLCIAKKLSGLIGMELKLISTNSMGTEFAIHIPLEKHASKYINEIYKASTITISNKKIQFDDLSTQNILVVDDDENSRAYMKYILEHENAIVTCADSASIALELISNQSERKFDVIMSDINMPDINGTDFVKNIKPKLPNAFIILFSANHTPLIEQTALESGADYYISKPIDSSVLFRILLSRVNS